MAPSNWRAGRGRSCARTSIDRRGLLRQLTGELTSGRFAAPSRKNARRRERDSSGFRNWKKIATRRFRAQGNENALGGSRALARPTRRRQRRAPLAFASKGLLKWVFIVASRNRGDDGFRSAQRSGFCSTSLKIAAQTIDRHGYDWLPPFKAVELRDWQSARHWMALIH